MASTATWALASPSTVVENRAASPRQPPPTPHCLGLPPRSRLLTAGASCQRTARGVIVMFSGITTRRNATGETVAATSSGEEEGSTELPEIVQTVQKAWGKVEDKYAVATIGVAAIIALWASAGVISAIDRLPIVPGVLELVGIGYTGWFAYQNLVFKPDREALLEKIKNAYGDITGSNPGMWHITDYGILLVKMR
ncbi:hypothetical protein Taro_043596 [Colocasia esculenta]|uniref:Cyanobacterial aminoacyl-tRNA synthetase CAAD domain-containing protein n=1 Tax=Colocasia esculenta TaxID=4460 RepID=A0A843WJU1_COLES|nr:hypothetical protein [Colocasia esculenta]